jgi:predicted ATPase
MLFVNSINKLPEEVKMALGALSCFGASTDCEVIQALETDLNLNLIEPLEVAIAEGLVTKLEGRYSFCHERIQEATCGMIQSKL